MAKCFIDDSTLTAIGNAIRAQSGKTDLMLPSAMATEIAKLSKSGLYAWKKLKDDNEPIKITSLGTEKSNDLTQNIPLMGKPCFDSNSYFIGYYDASFSGTTDIYVARDSNTIYKIYASVGTQISCYKYVDCEIKYGTSCSEYIVSDNENAYPNGGYQYGYYYERVYISFDVLAKRYNCTKMAIDTFVLSTNVYDNKYPCSHSLGEVPKIAFILADPTFTPPKDSNWYIKYTILDYSISNDYYVYLVAKDAYYSNATASGGGNPKSSGNYMATTTTVTSPDATYFAQGVTYTVITMA